MFDLISLGDARIDNYYFIDDATLHCRHNTHDCELCLRYGQKVPVSKFVQFMAGNNANTAVGVSRLGLKSALYGHVGKDASGEFIVKVLKDEKISTRFVEMVEGMETENSAVIDFQKERTILVYHQPWEYALPDLDKSKWVYFSSMSYSFSKTNIVKEIENYVQRTGAKLVFSPGTHQLKYGVKKFPQLLSLVTLFIVNVEEAKKVLGYEQEENIPVKKLLHGLVDLGPVMVIITDAKNGSYGFDGTTYYKLDIFPAKLVEMTGAGDAYTAGVMAGLFYGKSLPEAMRWGTANGASVIEHVGPQAGLLTYDQMQNRLKENAKIVTKELR